MDQARRDVCAMAVMAKAPRSGEVKTRLIPPLTAEEAATLSICFLKDITANFMAASWSVPIAGYIAFSPPESEALFRKLVRPEIDLLASRRIGLGHSLLDATEDLLAMGYDGACLVNSDSPTLPTSILVEAAEALRAPGDRVVLGPASDGGYYLIGLKQPHRRLFEDIAWSTERVFRQTAERAASIALDVVTLPRWYDVDDATSLGWLVREVLAGERPPDCARQGYAAPDSSAYLRALATLGGGDRLGVDRTTIEPIPP
ncbi:MAG: TIGR04282 family arsenosugar biosynthesis glycosyltransferase [Stellaceae bacterium]